MSEYKIDFNLRPFLNTNTHTSKNIALACKLFLPKSNRRRGKRKSSIKNMREN